jgi:mRNA-degrading endonuclease RelE of RelBE toxin-antitoxin system
VDRYTIVFEARAQREFDALAPAMRRRFYRAFDELVVDPLRPRPRCDIRKLKGAGETFALRVGRYRAIFAVVNGTIMFTKISGRKVSYRGL